MKIRKKIHPLIFSILLIGLTSASHAQSVIIDDAILKAVFLERFTRFIDWPQQKISHDSQAFVITVIGDEKFSHLLKRIYKTKKIKNKPVLINELNSFDDLTQSHILFIANQTIDKLPDILDIVKKLPILTVSDSAGAAQQGVLINFFPSSNTMRFEINQAAVNHSGLRMSFKLLSQAVIVK